MQRYTLYLYLETALHVSGGFPHPSSGVQTSVSTASGICHTVTATFRYRGRVGTALQFQLFKCKSCWDPKDVRSFLTLTGS